MGWEDIGPNSEEVKRRISRKGGVDDEGRTQYQLDVAGLTASSSELDPDMPYESAQAQDQAINDLLNPIVQGSFDISDRNIQDIIGRFQEDAGVAQPQQVSRHPHAERWMQNREDDFQKAQERSHEKQIGLLQDDLDRLITMGAPAVENVRDLATLAMAMHKSDDATSREEAQALFHLFKDYPPFHHLIEVETNYETTFEDLYQPPSGPNPIMSAIGWTFDTLFRPVSAVIPIVMDIKNLDFKSAYSRGLQSGIDLLDFFTPDFVTDQGILASAESWLEEHQSDLSEYDLNGDGRISIKESELNPLSDVPVLGPVTDFVAEVMFDPLTWATLGVGGVVKGAMKAGGKTILTATANPTGAKNFFKAAGAIKKGGVVDNLSDDVFQRYLHHIKNGFDTGIPWKKLRKQIADDIGENYSDEALDEVLRAVMSGSRTGREAAKRLRLEKKIGGMEGDSIRKTRLQRRVDGIADDLKIGDDGVADLISQKKRKIERRIKQVQKRSGGGLAFGAGTHKYYVPGTRGLYQWFKKNGIAITPAKFLMGSRKLPTLFGHGYASIKPTGGVVEDLHYMGWGAEVIHQAGPRAGGYSVDDFVQAWKQRSLNTRAKTVIDPMTGETLEATMADAAFQRTRTAGAAPETEGGVKYRRPGHADEGLQLSDEITRDEAKKILEMMEEAGAVKKDQFGNYHQTWKNRTPKKDVRYEGRPVGGPRMPGDPPDAREAAMEAFTKKTQSGDVYIETANTIDEWINNPFALAPPQGAKVEDLFVALERRIDRIDDRIDVLYAERRKVEDRIIYAQADVALSETPDAAYKQLDELDGELSKIDREIDAMEEIAQELTDQQHYIQSLVERFHGWDTIDEVTTSPLAKPSPKVFSDEAIEGAEEVTNYKDPVVDSGPRITQSEGATPLTQEAKDEVRQEVYQEYGIKFTKDGGFHKGSKAWREAKKKLGPDADDVRIEREVRARLQQANQDVKARIADREKAFAKSEKAGNKNKVRRLIASHDSNPRSGMVVKRIQEIEAGDVPPEQIKDRDRRRIERHNNVLLPGRSQGDGSLRPSDWFRRAEKWSENMAIGGDAALFDAETLQMWGGGVQAIGDEKTITLASGKKVDVVHPTGSPDFETPRRKAATTDTRESAEAVLKEEMGDLWDEMPNINETARAWEKAQKNAKNWDSANDAQRKALVREELIKERMYLSKRGVMLEVSENGKFWHSVTPPRGTKGFSKTRLNPTTAFGPEDVGSYQPLTYYKGLSKGKRPDVASKNPIGFEVVEGEVKDGVASGSRQAVYAENLENEHAWHLVRTNIDSMIDILTVAEANGMGSWDEILRILDDADWDDDLVEKLTDTPFGNKGIRNPAEMQILGNPYGAGPPRSVMPLGLKDMLGEQTRLHYQLAAPKGLVGKGVHKVTKPFLGTVRYGLKKTEGLRSFVRLGKQGNRLEREVARESKSRNMANARMEHDTRMTVLTKYRDETEKMFKASGVDDAKTAVIQAINKVRQAKVGENRDAVYKEFAKEHGEELTDRIRRMVTEIDNYSHSQLEIIEDVLSRELKIKNPNYDPNSPRTDVQYDADGVAIPTAEGAKHNPKYIPLDPETYNPRVLTPEAEKAFIDIFKDNGDPAMRLYRAELANGENVKEYIRAAAKKAGWDEETTQQAIEEWGKLFGGLKQAGAQAAPEALNGSLNAARMFSTLAESGHMKAREFLPQIQNVQEINQFINDVLDQVASTVKKLNKENGGVVEGWGITRFYEEDPIDAWIRYSSSYQDQQVVYDFLNDMEELYFNDIFDETGEALVDRPAVFKSEFEIVEPMKPTYDEVVSDRTVLRVESKDPQYKMTIEGVRGDTIVMRSHARETKDEFLNRVRARVSEDAGGANYEVVPVGSGARIVDAELAREIQENIIGQLKNNHLQGTASELVNRWTTGWATYATVPLIGFAFHMRNAVGNFFNMAVAGVRNPMVVVEAMRMQALNRGVKKFMQEYSYLSYDEALDALIDGEGGGLNKIVKGINRVTADDRIKLRMIRDSAIVNPGFFQDLGRDAGIFDKKGGTNKATRLGNAYINNPVTKLGRGMGSIVEDNARISLFLDGVDKGMDVYEAGMRTKEYLFDYTELTKGERKIKNFSRFYTWMRKNTALQMRMMVSQPGSVWNTQKMVDGVLQNILGTQEVMGETFMPEWAEDRNWLFNPHDMYMARMETPFISAIETLEKGAYLTTVGDINPLLPWDYREASLGQRLGDSVGLFASGPQSGLTAFVEEVMGKSMYSGATLNDDRAWAQVYRLVVNPMIPAVTKGFREWAKVSGQDPMGVVTDHQEMESFWSDEDKRNIRLANLFFGVSTYSLNEEQQMRHIGFVRGQYDDIRKEMREAGVDIPTMAELREANAYNEADRVAKILIFSQSSAAAIDNAVQENVWDLLEEYGLPREYVAPRPEKTMEEHRDDVRVQIALAEEVLNRGREGLAPLEFPPEWKLKIALAVHGGLNNAELESFGIEPLRENQFLNSEDVEEDLVRMNTALNIVLDAAGISNAQARAFRPVLPDAIRYVKDKVEMGVDLNQAVWDYMLELSRRKRQELGIPLDVLDYDKTPSANDIRKMIQKTRQSVAEIMMISWAFGIQATEADIQHWILYGDTNLPAASLERLGLPNAPKQTRREDARSDEEKTQGDLITLEALTAGGMPAIR